MGLLDGYYAHAVVMRKPENDLFLAFFSSQGCCTVHSLSETANGSVTFFPSVVLEFVSTSVFCFLGLLLIEIYMNLYFLMSLLLIWS